MKRKIIILLIALSPFIYINTDYFIQKHDWKLLSTTQITNFLFFTDKDNYWDLKYHTVYVNGKKRGYVILSLYKVLIILNSKNELCYYYKFDY